MVSTTPLPVDVLANQARSALTLGSAAGRLLLFRCNSAIRFDDETLVDM